MPDQSYKTNICCANMNCGHADCLHYGIQSYVCYNNFGIVVTERPQD